MFIKFAARNASFFFLIFALVNFVSAQANQYKTNPPAQQKIEDDTERVTTEEIKLNVTARNDYGNFDPTLILDDLMVVEDRVPHSIASLRRVPANVLIVLDTGGEMRFAKTLRSTREVATSVVNSLNQDNALAVMQYSDKPEILVEWTGDKNQILEAINKKSNFGKRSQFVAAMTLAVKFLQNRPNENRHLVLITDGTDSAANKGEREAALKKLLAANVSVHILSYTQLEQGEIDKSSIFQKGQARAPKRTDDTHKATLPGPIQDMMNMPRLGSINTDTAMLRARRQRRDALKQSQEQLTVLAKETGGEMIAPDNAEELSTKAKEIAAVIDSQYVITYLPKRSLSNSPAGEVRVVDVIPRRDGLTVQARRKFIVPARE
jgi:VWFA-related protein